MPIRIAVVHHTFLGVRRTTWIILACTLAWCLAFYLIRTPQRPWAFDSPAAQFSGPAPNALQTRYPPTVVNCGAAPPAGCARYCDQQAETRYVECVVP